METIVQLHPVIDLTDAQFYEFCQLNRDVRIERNSRREVLIVPPTGGDTGERNAEINTLLFDDVLAVGTFPGEFFVEHGMRFKQQSMVESTIFAGYTNGALGYFPTIRAAAEGGYGGKEATLVEVGAGERLVNEALKMLHQQLGKLSDIPQFE